MEDVMVGGLVGGVAGYIAAGFQAWQDRRRRKHALASVLLLELRGVEYLLHRFAEDLDNPTGDFHADHFDRLDVTAAFDLEDKATALALEFKYRLDEISQLRERQAKDVTKERRQRIKVKLVFAARLVHELKRALLQSRGVEPARADYEEVSGDLPMPPKAFDYGPPGPAPIARRPDHKG